MRRRVGILISGRGSNMTSLVAAAKDPAFPAEIGLVLSNRMDAAGLGRASEAGIPTAIVDHRQHGSRAEFDASMEALFVGEGIDLVCLAGFMRILSEGFVSRWEGRMLNIHPSLLPAFKGLHPHRQALEAGVRLHGCTVHFVVPELDAGPTIVQATVPVEPDDTEATLAARVLEAEHRLYPKGLALVASGAVRLVEGRIVTG